MRVQILSSQHPGDMSGWLKEKSQSLLEQVTLLYDDLRKRDDLPEGLMNDLESYLYLVFENSTKILSFASGAEWQARDRDTIIEQGTSGLEEVLVKYGLLDETSEDKRTRKIQAFVKKFKVLVHEPGHIARTRIHEMLVKEGFEDPATNEISGLIEKVTMGELPWEEFVNLATDLIRRMEANT